MAEMERCSPAKIVPPDINRSGTEFFTDYATDEIFWSLTRIKQVGLRTVEYIVTERDRAGHIRVSRTSSTAYSVTSSRNTVTGTIPTTRKRP